ncbi:hypothetical protein [Vibrio phage S4-7]|nr:hypothetical protein [Vibrio phage S4-7]
MSFFNKLFENGDPQVEKTFDLELEQLRIKQTLALYGGDIKEDINNFVLIQQLQNALQEMTNDQLDRVLSISGLQEHKDQLVSLKHSLHKQNTLQSFFESFSEGDITPDTTFKVIVSDGNNGFKTFTILD